MKKLFLTVIILFTIMSCSTQNCKDLPSQFSSYSQAVKKVKSSNFSFIETDNTSRSSVIESADYYNCDSKTGYLIIEIRNTNYIYQNVPISVWNSFKSADSYGDFYNDYVKGNFNLEIK